MVGKPERTNHNRRPATPATTPATTIVCGFHAVRSLLTKPPSSRIGTQETEARGVMEVFIDQSRCDQRQKQLQQDLEQAGICCRYVPSEQLEKLSSGVRHQGVVARVRQGWEQLPLSHLYQLLDRLERPALLLILDQVQDPHNLGACLRSAEGAGVDAVVLPKNGACPITPSVVRVATGAVGNLPLFYVANLARTMVDLQSRGVWITGGDHTVTRTLYEMDFTADVAIAIGAEGNGLRRLTRHHCDQLARIPMAGEVSSLNVSVATALFLFEVIRQRAR